MSDFTTYKLVPVNKFRKMMMLHTQQNACSHKVGTGDVEPATQADTMMPVHVGDGAQKFTWPVSDPSVHPKYSIENKIDSSLSEYEAILKSAIPEQIKAKLLSHYRTKYIMNKQHAHDDDRDDEGDEDNSEDEDDGDSADAKKYMELGVLKVLGDIVSPGKRGRARHILDVMITRRDLVRWNRHGVMTMPKNGPIAQLKQLVTTLIYVNRGTDEVHRAIANIVRPLFPDIEPFVINRKVINYVNPPTPSRKKKKKKKKTGGYISLP